jgi:hypothetical protein
MESEIKWVVGFVLAMFLGLFVAIGYGESLQHTEKMECMKLKGEYIGKGCVFREAKPQ